VQSDVVGDGSDNNRGLTFFGVGRKSRKRQRLSVSSRHEQSSENDLVEFGVGSSGQESVEFDQHVQVEVVGFGGFSDSLSVFFVFDIDTHF